jgi:SAM-dependent methyltransferase
VPVSDWDDLADWWLTEVTDPAYREEVVPLCLDLLAPGPGEVLLDVGCGEGGVSRTVAATGATVVGVDGSPSLAARAPRAFVARLPDLAAVRDASFDGAFMVLVLEHLPDEAAVLAELARVVRPGGKLVLVVNHPYFTAPDAAPVTDPIDLEVFWRPGRYLGRGHTDEPAGEGTIRFHHRPLGELLTTAAGAGWSLQRLVERGPGRRQVRRDPTLADQAHVPRLLGAHWVRR